MGVDDFTIVWWDPKATGPDEQDKEGVGMWRYAAGGRRLLLGDVPKLPTRLLFDEAGTVTLQPEVPKEDRVPDYPAWPGSPAAGG